MLHFTFIFDSWTKKKKELKPIIFLELDNYNFLGCIIGVSFVYRQIAVVECEQFEAISMIVHRLIALQLFLNWEFIYLFINLFTHINIYKLNYFLYKQKLLLPNRVKFIYLYFGFTFGLIKHNWFESLSSTIERLFNDCSLQNK